MTDLRKAAEMALDALDIYREHNEENIGLADAAYEALRQALAQPEQYDQTALELCNVCGWKAVIPDEGCLVCARKNQEPVAWRNTETGEFCTGGFLRKDLAKWMPLYTALPKHEWVGLTRKEAEDVVDNFITLGGDVENWVGYWQAIEAKLKEKNT